MTIVVEQLPSATPAQGSRVERLVLTWEQRSKTRQRVASESGREIVIKLATGTRLPPGTVVWTGTGVHVEVVAAAEDVWLIRTADAQTLARVAYEIGNRHFPIEFGNASVTVLYDHTLAELWARLGVDAERVQRPFLSEQQPTHHHP